MGLGYWLCQFLRALMRTQNKTKGMGGTGGQKPRRLKRHMLQVLFHSRFLLSVIVGYLTPFNTIQGSSIPVIFCNSPAFSWSLVAACALWMVLREKGVVGLGSVVFWFIESKGLDQAIATSQ